MGASATPAFWNGTTNHLASELLKPLTDAPPMHVFYRSSDPAMTDLLLGTVTSM